MIEKQEENFDARFRSEKYYEEKAEELKVTVEYYLMEFVK